MQIMFQQLRDILSAAKLPAFMWQYPDATYETVSLGHVLEVWSAWLEARPAQLCVLGEVGGKTVRLRPLWISDASDCDDLAIGVMSHAQVGNALTALRAPAMVAFLACGAAILVALLVVTLLALIDDGVEWFHERELLGPFTFAALVAVVVLALGGCRTADPRDPDVWRPRATITYPEPR